MTTSQRCDFIRIVTVHSQLPISHQFISVEFYQRLYEAQLFSRQFPSQYFAVYDAYGSFKLGILSVNMWQMMMLIVEEIHANYDPIKH